jgi:hypothetical protein
VPAVAAVAVASDRTSSGYFLRREQDEVVKRLEQRIADWTKLPLVNGEPFHVSSSGSRSAAAMAAAGVAATVAAAVHTAAGPCGTSIRRCGAGVTFPQQGLARLSREAGCTCCASCRSRLSRVQATWLMPKGAAHSLPPGAVAAGAALPGG